MPDADAPSRLRLFVAAEVPPAHLDWVAEAVAPLQETLPQARWVPKQNQHITLKFLGWVDAMKLDEVGKAVERVAAAHAPAPVAVSGFGCFPHAGRARVLWAGLDDGAGVLARMAKDLDSSFVPLGIDAEDRAFVPHLTLARLRRPQPVALPDPAEAGPGPFPIDHVTLFRSYLSPRGPRYELLARYPLTAVGA